jgi:riboflavin transporter FmnP
MGGIFMQTRTRKLTVTGILCALTYVVMFFGRIPVVGFLKYDPSDVVVTIGGFLLGPLTALAISVLVPVIEMLTVSDTGPIGALMNIISTAAFACLAAYVYKKKHDMKGAVIGLVGGVLLMTALMLLWNYAITPGYMGVEQEDVNAMLLPMFLPFNLLKGGLNAAFTLLLYKPLANILRKSGLLPATEKKYGEHKKVNVGVILASLFVIATGMIVILVFQGIL